MQHQPPKQSWHNWFDDEVNRMLDLLIKQKLKWVKHAVSHSLYSIWLPGYSILVGQVHLSKTNSTQYVALFTQIQNAVINFQAYL